MTDKPVRFRHLVQHGADLTTGPREPVGSGKLGVRLGRKHHDAGPVAVEDQYGEGSLEQVLGYLASGALSPNDLVDLGRGWETISDTPELADAAAAAPRRYRFKLLHLVVGCVALMLVLAAVLPKRLVLHELGISVLIMVIGTCVYGVWLLLRKPKASVSHSLFEPPKKR